MAETPQINAYDEFLFNATTHLTKPLHEILSSCDELGKSLGQSADEAQKQLSRQIMHQGHRLLDLVNDIRDYAEMQTGRIVIEKKPTDMALLLKGVLDVAAWLTKNKPEVRIEQDIPASLPQITIHDMRVQQVLVNLVHNAVKFTDAGTIKISAEVRDNNLLFQVRDTGVGITEDGFALVFAPFQTAFPDPADGRVGLGLGLPICKYMADAHQGKIWFESAEGKGSTFYFSLPVE